MDETLPKLRDGNGTFPIVGVGASAGGLEAFTQLLNALPMDTGMGFVLVQHLDPEHESALTQILSRATALPVSEITHNQPVQADHVYVIPRDTSLSIAEGVLKLEPRQKIRAPHRPIDAFFESLAQDQRDRAIGVVLSGTATDGTLGLEAIKAEGGITFAQDDSAKHDSMPRSAVAAGCVDLVLSPAEIAQELARISKHPYAAGQPLELATRGEVVDALAEDDRGSDPRGEDERAQATAHQDDDSPLPSGGPPGKKTPRKDGKPPRARATRQKDAEDGRGLEAGYKKILLLLRNHSGVDFALYKSTTIQRRINRRMILTKHDQLADYAGFLRGNAKELDALYSDVLISVTSFFRNPEMFDALQREVLPELLQQRGDDPLRCWVLGCSTGQEAYSIAMSFMEAAEKVTRLRKFQIFATDLNEALLDKARHGLYAKSLADDITPERLRRFFVEEAGGYRVRKPLREMVVFARQNLIADPPFSRMDIVSCRNLLIYLEPSLQKKALPTFHYALKPGGYLLLGASESIGSFTDLFEPVDKKHKIYAKKPAPTPAFHLPVARARGEPGHRPLLPMRQPESPEPSESLRGELNAQREADRITVNQFAPPGVLINDALQVLQFRGPTGAYLEPPPGKASFDVLKMAREGLMMPLRAAINQARKENKTARRENVRVQRDGQTRTANLQVIPLKNLREHCFLIVFEEADQASGGRQPPDHFAQETHQPAHAPRSPREEECRIAELEIDLSETREYLQSMLEQHEAANEELQAANEEVQSANEELQSINEELETSKEELESANEELTTVNEEMSNRNAELNRLNNDLVNLQSSTKLSIVLLGRDLTIRRFSPQAEKQFDLLATDVGRTIRNVRHNLVLPDDPDSPLDLEGLCAEVIESVRERECEVRDRASRWYSLRLRPYLTLDNRVDGAVLVLVDIDAIKRAEEATAHLAAIVESSDDAIISKDLQSVITSWNKGAERLFGYAAEEVIGQPVLLLIPPDLVNEEPEILERIRRGESVEHYETVRQRRDGSLLNISLTESPIRDAAGRIIGAAKIARDITDRKRVEAALRESEERYHNLFNSMDEGYCIIEMLFDQREQPVDYRFLEVNPAFEKQSGMRDVIGKRMREFVSEIEERWLANYGQVALTGEPIRFADEYKALGGRWFDVYAFRIGGPDSRRVAVLFNNIKERKEAERALGESEERFRTLADNMSQFAWTADAQGWIYWYNERWYDYTGTTLEAMQGWGWKQVQHPDHVDRVVERIQHSWDTGEPWEDSFPLRGKDGEYRWFLSRALPIRDVEGHVLRWFGTNTDVTEQREMDEQLARQAEQLAVESRNKDEFLAMLSHELRNPLAPILNAVKLLCLQKDEDELQRQARGMIERQVGQLTRLVDDLLEVSRITTGRIHLHQERLVLNGIAERAVETVRPLIEERRHSLHVSLSPQPLWLHADADRLEQVVVNLLTNAAKYTDEGGTVWLSVEREGDEAALRVRDTGVGMDPELLPRIFDLFTQAERSLDRSQGGLGIGLCLVQRLVEMHQGRVEVSSSLGQGTEFVVRLPLLQAEGERGREEPNPPDSAVRRPPSALKVLVVDDNVDAARTFGMLLKASGHDVRTAHDGPAALEAASDYRPHMVLLDIGLPGMNGLEVARQLREQPLLENVVLVAMTGYGQEADRRRSLEAGFDHHLVKPADFGQVLQILASVSEKGT